LFAAPGLSAADSVNAASSTANPLAQELQQLRATSPELRRQVMEDWHKQLVQDAPAFEQPVQMEIVSDPSLEIGVEVVIAPASSLVGQLQALQLDSLNVTPEERRERFEAWHIGNAARLSSELNVGIEGDVVIGSGTNAELTVVNATTIGEPLALQLGFDEATVDVSPEIRRLRTEVFIQENWNSISTALGESSERLRFLIDPSNQNAPNNESN
jgi:hypothetical protein